VHRRGRHGSCRGFDLDLEETVAVKFLCADLTDGDSLRVRFRREVKLARRVTPPHFAYVFEFGRDGALCFLTMEFVPGESLQALLRREAPLPPNNSCASRYERECAHSARRRYTPFAMIRAEGSPDPLRA
jgi:serine/threonine protein kinase